MIRVVGDRVLVALPPREDEIVSAGGIVLVKDPDRFHTPTRGIVVALGEKSGTVDLDDVCQHVDSYLFAEWSDDGITDWIAFAKDMERFIRGLSPAPFDVQVGDCVIFPQSAGEEIHDGDVDYVVLRESDIIGIVEPKNEAA